MTKWSETTHLEEDQQSNNTINVLSFRKARVKVENPLAASTSTQKLTLAQEQKLGNSSFSASHAVPSPELQNQSGVPRRHRTEEKQMKLLLHTKTRDSRHFFRDKGPP